MNCGRPATGSRHPSDAAVSRHVGAANEAAKHAPAPSSIMNWTCASDNESAAPSVSDGVACPGTVLLRGHCVGPSRLQSQTEWVPHSGAASSRSLRPGASRRVGLVGGVTARSVRPLTSSLTTVPSNAALVARRSPRTTARHPARVCRFHRTKQCNFEFPLTRGVDEIPASFEGDGEDAVAGVRRHQLSFFSGATDLSRRLGRVSPPVATPADPGVRGSGSARCPGSLR